MMIAVQEYLRSGRSVDDLATELGINVYRHPALPLVGLKYSQINSPKNHPIVRECRGIVLEDGTWNIAAKPFRRFFNPGEYPEAFAAFDWSDFTCTAKEDGSLMIAYHYAGEWHVNTSGSFGLLKCGDSGRTWRELFWWAVGVTPADLNPAMTYVWELWTRHNKVIRVYPGPTAFLLGMFDNRSLAEVEPDAVDDEARWLGVQRPTRYHFTSMDDVTAHLAEMEARDRTYEGVVIRDRHGERWKLKTKTYLELHRLHDNGNIASPKQLIPIILAGEQDEVCAYFPELRPHIDAIAAELAAEFEAMLAVWRKAKDIPAQGDFARAILPRTPYSGILFHVRKMYGENQTEDHLRDQWRRSADSIVRRMVAV